MRVPPVAAGALVAGAIFVSSSAARGQCTTSNSTASEPIALELAGEAGRARTWRYVWTGINEGSAAISLAAIPILKKSETPTLVVGAVTSAVSGAFTWFWPLDVERDAELAAHLGCLSPADRELELQRLREHSANDETARYRWPWHVGNFITALIPGAILWFGYNRRLDGALATVGGFASGEVELLTQPMRLTVSRTPQASSGVRAIATGRSAMVIYVVDW